MLLIWRRMGCAASASDQPFTQQSLLLAEENVAFCISDFPACKAPMYSMLALEEDLIAALAINEVYLCGCNACQHRYSGCHAVRSLCAGVLLTKLQAQICSQDDSCAVVLLHCSHLR